MSDWPTEVPHLTARDIHKGDYENSRNPSQCCTWGHLNKIFGENSCSTSNVGARALRRKVVNEIRRLIPKRFYGSIVNWNDHPETTKTEIANTINKAFEHFGYTEWSEEDE